MYNKIVIIVIFIFIICLNKKREYFSPAYNSCKKQGYPEKFCQLVPNEFIDKGKLNNCRYPYLPLRN